MGLYNTFVRRRRCQPAAFDEIANGLNGLSIQGVASTTATYYPNPPPVHIELQEMGGGNGNGSGNGNGNGGGQSVYSKFVKRGRKREVAAENAVVSQKRGKKRHVKDYLPDRDATIGALTLTLTAVRDIGDATNIGYMKGLAGLALLIIEVTEGVRTCRSEVQRLTRHIVELVNALYNELKQKLEPPSPETLYQMQSLQGKLERIHAKLQKMREGNYWTRLLRQADDNGEIVRFNEDIKHHLRVFGIQQNLSIHSNLAKQDGQAGEHKSSLLTIIDTGHRTQMRAIQRTMSGDGAEPSTPTMAILDGSISSEPDSMDMDVDMENDIEEGTINDGAPDQSFGHCLPPNLKTHFGHEEFIEHIASLLVLHQNEEVVEGGGGSYNVTPRPSTPVMGTRTTPTIPGVPSVALSNPFMTPPSSPNSFSLSSTKSFPFTPHRSDSLLSTSSSSSSAFSLLAPSSASPIKPYARLPSTPASPNSQFSFLPSTSTPSSPLPKSQSFPAYMTSLSLPSSSKLPSSSYFPTPPLTPNSGALTSAYHPSSPIPLPPLPITPSSHSSSFASLIPSTPKHNSTWPLTLTPTSQNSIFAKLQPSRPTTPTPSPSRPQGPARFAILGPQGIGKSSIAQRVMHQVDVAELYRDRRIFIDCNPANDCDELIETIVGTLNVAEQVNGTDKAGELVAVLSGMKDQLQKRVHRQESTPSFTTNSPSMIESSTSSTFSRDSEELPPMDELPPTLLILDNLDKCWGSHSTRYEVENLLNLIAACSSIALIVTLRGHERPLGVKWTRPFLSPVEPVSKEVAARIFTTIADTEDPLVMDIIECCEGNPSMLTQCAASAQYETLPALLSRLQGEKRRREKKPQPLDVDSVCSDLDMTALPSIRTDIAGRY